jgi:hypothetical protein
MVAPRQNNGGWVANTGMVDVGWKPLQNTAVTVVECDALRGRMSRGRLVARFFSVVRPVARGTTHCTSLRRG